jgi:hypothetical protein
VRCGAPYSAIFLLHTPTPTLIKIGCGAVLAIFSVVSVKLTPLVTSLVFPKEVNVNIIYQKKKKFVRTLPYYSIAQ